MINWFKMSYLVRYIYFCLLCLGLLLVSCRDKDEDGGETFINLQSKEILFDANGGSLEVPFSTSADWAVVMYYTPGNWCTTNKTAGSKGNSVLVITASENKTNYERNTAIRITCKEKTEKIIVTQKQKDAILLSSNKVEVDRNGGERIIVVNANVDYECTVESGSEWITVQPATKGMISSDFSLKIAPNHTFEKRQGIVIVKAESISERIDIYQAASVPELILSENLHIAKSTGDTVKVEVKSNCDYSCNLPELDWISETESGMQSQFTHYFAIKPNETRMSRTATVIFTNLYNGDKEELTITQLPEHAITTARSEYNLNPSKKEILLRLNSNVDFNVDVPVNWIHVSQKETTEPLKFYDISMVVDENKTHEPREAFVTFYTVELIQRVVVRQDGRSDYVKAVIQHHSPDLKTSVSGSKLYGFVDWGDGNSDNLNTSNTHTYSDTIDRYVKIDCWGISSFKLPSLTNVSSVAIYVNGDSEAGAEDFVVEKRGWDR